MFCSTKLYSAALHKVDEKYMDSDTLTFSGQTARQKNSVYITCPEIHTF